MDPIKTLFILEDENQYLTRELEKFRLKYEAEHRLVLKLKKAAKDQSLVELSVDQAWEKNGERLG